MSSSLHNRSASTPSLNPGSRPRTTLLDVLALILVGLAAIEFVAVLVVHAGRPPLTSGIVAMAAAIAIPGLMAVIAAVLGRFGTTARHAARVSVFLAAAVAAKLFYDRWPHDRPTTTHTIVVLSDSTFPSLDPELRVRWATRLAAHAISTGGLKDSTLSIPGDWPFPTTVEIGLQRTADSVIVTGIEAATNHSCSMVMYLRPIAAPIPGRHSPVSCSASRADQPVLTVTRSAGPLAQPGALKADPNAKPWPQYRLDPKHAAGEVSGSVGSRAWRRPIDGEVRSSASISGNKVLIGTHGPGALYAIDARNGSVDWMHYLPNWVHQDATTDGRVLVAGFGDNTSSLYGLAPSGVAAFSLADGRPLWTAFEGNSVMASPVIWNGNAVYITSAGALRVRDLVSGAERGRMEVPGRATMAPPALVGDTLITTLDTARVCAIRMRPLEQIWCTRLPDVAMLGHAAPTIIGNRVYVTGGVPNRQRRFGLTWETRNHLLNALALGPVAGFEFEGQRLWALDMATGKVLWQSRVYESVNSPVGHVSGTLVGEKDRGVVVLPLAGKMVAFDLDSGREQWVQDVGTIRGPPLPVDNRLILTLRTGEIRVVQAATGSVDCSLRTETSFDRAGPVRADSTVFVGTAPGLFAALPLGMLLGCDAQGVQRILQ